MRVGEEKHRTAARGQGSRPGGRGPGAGWIGPGRKQVDKRAQVGDPDEARDRVEGVAAEARGDDAGLIKHLGVKQPHSLSSLSRSFNLLCR